MTTSDDGTATGRRTPLDRETAIDEVARQLGPQISVLARLLFARARTELGRTEASVLRTVAQGPIRITELAAAEHLAQPSVTSCVAGLEGRGLVERRRDPRDGRAVLVTLTQAGHDVRTQLHASLAEELTRALQPLDDGQVADLQHLTRAIPLLIDALQVSGKPEQQRPALPGRPSSSVA